MSFMFLSLSVEEQQQQQPTNQPLVSEIISVERGMGALALLSANPTKRLFKQRTHWQY